MNKVNCFAIFLILCLFYSNSAFGEAGDRLEVDGYKFHISTNLRGNILQVRGSVNGGKKCNKLTVDIFLHNETGNICHVIPILDNYKGSDKFSVSDKVYGSSRSRWSVSNVYIKCY
jgi:hypothetical protein